MNRTAFSACTLFCVLTAWLPMAARADVIEYTLPGTDLTMLIQGSAKRSGRTVIVNHAKYGVFYFSASDAKVHEVSPTIQIFGRKLGTAQANKDADAVMEAAQWALRHGLLPQVYAAVDAALAIDPQHAGAQNMAELREKIRQPLPDNPQQEEQLKKSVRLYDMKVAKSNHYLLLHDTPDEPTGREKKSRSESRLALLEQVYESFLLRFYSQGVELEVPQERLMVVLFNEYDDFLDYSTSLSPSLASAAGFWDPDSNVAYFYDQGSDDLFKALERFAKEMIEAKEEAIRLRVPGSGEIRRIADAMVLLVDVARENEDITVVSHECTHQMAGNTGLLPRGVSIPSWVHEGLATYFESPSEAAWSGIGAVNETRINWYRALEPHKSISNIDFIVGDQIFDYAASHGAKLHGYGQAWALTHFLMERRFDQFMDYYRRLGELPPDIVFNAEALNEVFTESFGEDRDTLNLEWRRYMRTLKTDMEEVLGEDY